MIVIWVFLMVMTGWWDFPVACIAYVTSYMITSAGHVRHSRKVSPTFNMAGAARKKAEEKATYYHYTDEQGLKGIKESGVIKGSSQQRGDARFGDGAYSTQLPPTTSKYHIAANNYDMRTNKGAVEDIVKSGNLVFNVQCNVILRLKNKTGKT